MRVVILGGGTAGWMAACLLAKRWGPVGHGVTVIESAEIGIVGVGEGSTPQLRAFMAELGLDEAEWMPKCHATYKTGIRFEGWSTRGEYESYFHPFATALDGFTQPAFFFNAAARRASRDVCALPDRFYLPALLAAQRRSPVAPENFPFDVSYGYHFDATLIGAMLRDHATGVLGVEHLEHRIEQVARDDTGDVTALVAADGSRVEGDFFIDASGFRSVIAQEALGVRFMPFAENLFNDRAVVMPTPVDPAGIAPQTVATALTNGWAWQIPLTNRTGNGYVFSSAYIDADAAETELRAHLGLLDSDVSARHLSMKVGRVETSWTRNCLAIGLAQGFIEPLEATALHIVQATVEGFIDDYEAGGFGPDRRDAFNARIAARYGGIRDYIVLHYRVNQRDDTAYWRDNAANQALSDSLKSMMTAWFTGDDIEAEVARQGIGKYYAPLSWVALLAGYGTFPPDDRLRVPEPGALRYPMAATDDFLSRCALNFSKLN